MKSDEEEFPTANQFDYPPDPVRQRRPEEPDPPEDALSPNKAIDKAIRKLMRGIDRKEDDVAVKILNSAITWEKVKYALREKAPDFDPDAL
jgi:hypothetical protein